MSQLYLVALVLIALSERSFASALPPPDIKSRVVETKLSDEVHFNEEQEHNADYDHEAFLGRDDIKEFDQLTPDESKARLGIIYEKIDKDSDGMLTEAELTEWIKHVQTRYVRVDTDRQWKEQNPDNNATLTWPAYRHRVYGDIREDDEDKEEPTGGYNYRLMLQRDKRRWKLADVSGDGELTKEEFSYFLHPEETDHMKNIIVDETIEDIDKDGDGKVSLAEYIGDMWPNSVREDNQEDEPDWVKTEREQFSKYRDQNQDGFMDHDEVRNWITPPDYDHTSAEAKHLIYESDVDKDGLLTKQEVIDKYEVFVGSQATDFGEVLRTHDEF